MKKVLITPRSFGKFNGAQITALLNSAGIEPIFNPSTGILTEEELIALLPEMDGVIIGVDPLSEKVLASAKKLSAIAKYGVGIDNIDITFAENMGIKVSRTVGANTEAVADYSFALLMAVARRIPEINQSCKQGDWGKKMALDIYGKKIGILGLGAIGKSVAKRAEGFDMQVYAYDIFKDDSFIEAQKIRFTDVETIVRECDFISIHLPLTKDTKHMLNYELLSKAKDNLIIINTSRGGVINEGDLYQLLTEGKIYGAGLDVFEEEPPLSSPLLTLDSVIVASHTAASTKAASEQMSLMAAENIIRDMEGEMHLG